jgi:uncharacterized protein (DUF362 family)
MTAPCRIIPISIYDNDLVSDAVERILHDNEDVVAHLQKLINPLVVLKPNWIQEGMENRCCEWEPVITHPVVVCAVANAIASRFRGGGTICICDAPHTYADFDAILSRDAFIYKVNALREHWNRVTFEILDLRREVWLRKDGVVVQRLHNGEDPRGYVALNLGVDSMLFGHKGEGKYYGADYDTLIVNAHHSGDKHEYLLAGTPIRADLFVNIPKMKTHKKTGITCSLKNLVGINGDKNWLPHHTQGSPSEGGDEFAAANWNSAVESLIKPRLMRSALQFHLGNWIYRKSRLMGLRILGGSKSVIRAGNWHGNDTCWRMVLDLNRALLYGNPDGLAHSRKPYLTIADGIVAGEGNGPLCPDAVRAGVLFGGCDPAVVDATACHLMGIEPSVIPLVRNAFGASPYPINSTELRNAEVIDERVGTRIALSEVRPALARAFRPHFGWQKVWRANGCPGF